MSRTSKSRPPHRKIGDALKSGDRLRGHCTCPDCYPMRGAAAKMRGLARSARRRLNRINQEEFT